MTDSGSRLLDEALSPQRIFLTRERTKEGLIQFLIREMGVCGEVENLEALRSAVFLRESLMSTGIGLGIGVPHARVSCMRRMVMAIGVNDQPLPDYESIDNQPVQMVFLVAGRPDQQSAYVRLLSELSCRVKQREIREAILSAGTPEAIYRELRKGM